MSEPQERPGWEESDAGTEVPDPPGAAGAEQAEERPEGRSALFWLMILLLAVGVVTIGVLLAAALVWYLIRFA